MTRLILACSLALNLFGQSSQQDYSSAVRAWNAGQISDAAKQLAALLNRDPEFFKAYQLYWDATARTTGEDAQRAAIEAAMQLFARTPGGHRTEDFYGAYKEGCHRLKRDEEAQRIEQEAKERFPRGLMVQKFLLDAAREERNARRSAQLYQQYMDRFDDNVSWSELAARDRFLLIEQHRDQFTIQELIEAASKWDSRERAFAHEFGSSARYSRMANEVAKALLDADPAASLDYSRKGVKDLAEHRVESDSADFFAQETFWPLMLEAQVKLRNWAEAERLGKAAVHEIEAGHLFPESTNRAEETRVRRLYAEALDHAGKVAEARFELAAAAALSPDATQPFEDYLRRHPLPDDDRNKLEVEARSIVRNADERRAMRAKADLLALEHKQPATPFRLKNLEGKEVALTDFRGKALVVAFWATWCGPCVEELRALNRFARTFADNPRAALLTVSIDDTLSVVLEFARKAGYHFQILKSDGQVERAYAEQKTLDGIQIPQLYVFDPQGNIRFHIVGFDDDGLFEQKINWMLEAVQR